MDDLRAAQVDFLTIGQYLQPTPKHHPVARFVTPDEFDSYRRQALGKGFLMVSASPLTRSSYHAGDDFARLRRRPRAAGARARPSAMPTHAEQRVLPYTPEQLFALVADVERYPEFLPWCVGARMRERQPDLIVADLIIGFRMFRERFTSRVSARPAAPHRCRLCRGAVQIPEQSLVFERVPGGCRIDFFVDFEFHSRLLQRVIEVLFHEAVRRMVAAFEGVAPGSSTARRNRIRLGRAGRIVADVATLS